MNTVIVYSLLVGLSVLAYLDHRKPNFKKTYGILLATGTFAFLLGIVWNLAASKGIGELALKCSGQPGLVESVREVRSQLYLPYPYFIITFLFITFITILVWRHEYELRKK